MSWSSAVPKQAPATITPPMDFPVAKVDWARLVTLDFETFYDPDYTLKKLSTSEYIRDKRFQALMCGIKIGNKPTKLVPGPRIATELAKIPWSTHTLLAHHAQFDGFILSHHYKVHPSKVYCTLSMARGLHSQEIGAGLDEVSQFYGGRGKIQGVLDSMLGIRFEDLWKNKPRWLRAAEYCVNDVEECLRVFKEMVVIMPTSEVDLIDVTCRMFTEPVLKVDIPRVEIELKRELQAKEDLLLSTYGTPAQIKARMLAIEADPKLLKKKKFQGCSSFEILKEQARAVIAGQESYADLLRAEGIDPPQKISPAWINKPKEERTDEDKLAYAFAKTDLEFVALLEHPRKRIRDLVELRLMVKSTINETRAERFLKAGANGWALPVYLKYAAAVTLRWGGGNAMNMQNLRRDSELRKSILAPKGDVIVVADSSQIEARTNAWLWGQDDLLQQFRDADAGKDRDPYCKFGDTIYGRLITKANKDERFVSKVAVLMLGYQAAAERFQNTLALGSQGPAVFLDIDICQRIVWAYRRRNNRIVNGWRSCQRIIEDMAFGRSGSYKCISWERETIWLPNGMALKYPNLRRRNRDGELQWVYDRKDQEVKIYGGLLCENLVQALARIIVAEQLLAISRKRRVVMTTHDEVVALTKKSQGQKTLDFMLDMMRISPTWAPDLPLNAEGGFDVNYTK